MFACRMKNIPPPFGKSRLLEIGASYGLFAYLALQSGYSVEAVEMNSECCRFLRSELDVNVMETSDVFSAMQTPKEYEVIALWQVFEHLSEPWKALDAFIKHLSEGGRIVIAVPDPDSLQFDLTGRYWMHLDAPRHLAFFPEEWFRRYAEERNMVITNVVRHDAEIEAHSGIGWVQSIRNILPSPWSYFAGGVLGYMIKWAMGPICRRTQRSCVFTVVMQSKKHKTEKTVAANE
jgi:protein-L-isoaspartate O-methyltransferase